MSFKKTNIQNNLLSNLDELINQFNKSNQFSQIDQTNEQIGGGKKYSKDEVTKLINTTTQHISVLFFQTQIETNAIKNKIDELIKTKPYLVDMMAKMGYDTKYMAQQLNQSGGSSSKKKYSQSYVDKVISNISGQYLTMYMQAENEKQFFANTYEKLLELSTLNPFVQVGRVVSNNSINQNKSAVISPKIAKPIYVSLKTLIDKLSEIMKQNNEILRRAVMLSNDKFTISFNGTQNKIVIVNRDSDTDALLKLLFNSGKGPLKSSNMSNLKVDYSNIDTYTPVVRTILNSIKFEKKDRDNIIVGNGSDSLLNLLDNTIKINGKTFKQYIDDASNVGAKETYNLINNYIIDLAYVKNGGLPKTLN